MVCKTPGGGMQQQPALEDQRAEKEEPEEEDLYEQTADYHLGTRWPVLILPEEPLDSLSMIPAPVLLGTQTNIPTYQLGVHTRSLHQKLNTSRNHGGR